MKTTQDIDQLFDLMNESYNENLLIPEVDIEELNKKQQEEKIKEHRSVTKRFVAFGIFMIPAFIFTKDIQTKINIILFIPMLMHIFWINHKGLQALKNQDKAVSFTEFEENKNQIREIFHKQFKKMRTPIYLMLLIGSCVNFYFITKEMDMFNIVGGIFLTLLGCFITVSSIQGLIKKYKK